MTSVDELFKVSPLPAPKLKRRASADQTVQNAGLPSKRKLDPIRDPSESCFFLLVIHSF